MVQEAITQYVLLGAATLGDVTTGLSQASAMVVVLTGLSALLLAGAAATTIWRNLKGNKVYVEREELMTLREEVAEIRAANKMDVADLRAMVERRAEADRNLLRDELKQIRAEIAVNMRDVNDRIDKIPERVMDLIDRART